MEPTRTSPARESDYTLRLSRREANPHYLGPASGAAMILSLPTPFPQEERRISMDNALWNAGLGKYSVCPPPRIESLRDWIERTVKDRPPQPRDHETGRFIAREASPQTELPLPSSVSELNAQLARVKVPKRQSKRRPK